jgi:hypothetical protein
MASTNPHSHHLTERGVRTYSPQRITIRYWKAKDAA